jgi:hypothetical protein
MNNSFLLFFFDMLLPYAFHLTYLNMSLPTGIHESSNTCLTCVCLIFTTCLVFRKLSWLGHMTTELDISENESSSSLACGSQHIGSAQLST